MLSRVDSTEPHLPEFSGVTWFQYVPKVEGTLEAMMFPTQMLPLAMALV
jgi:hypothetical protein